MSLVNKIKNSIEGQGLTCLYDSTGDINRLLDYQDYPLAFFTLINTGGLITINNVYREIANVAVFFVNTSTFDFDSIENEAIIENCKVLALTWLDSLKWGGVLKAEVLDTNRVYNYADSILTGYVLNLRITELEGEGCLNPLIPDDRKKTVSIVVEEGGSVEGAGTYIKGSTVNLTATSDLQHRFDGWYKTVEEVDVLVSSNSNYSFVIEDDVNLKAKFRAKRLVVNCESGTYINLINSDNNSYQWYLDEGENIYTGTEPGFAINEITGLTKQTYVDTSLVSIDASDLTSWTEITNQAFNSCRVLTTVILPNTITSIGAFAFQSCDRLTSINLPEGLTTIGPNAFSTCSNLSHIDFPSTLTELGSTSFISCGLTSVVVPASLTTIAGGVFQNNTSMTSITFLSTTPPTMTGSNAFVNTNDCPIYVPADSVNAYKTANRWFSYADRIQAITE